MTTGEAPGQLSALALARQLAKGGDQHGALEHLRQQLAGASLHPHEVLSAGKLLAKLLACPPAGIRPQQFLLLGQCTTHWLAQAITASAHAAGLPAVVTEGPFDNVLQALTELSGDQAPDVLVLLPWHDRLLGRYDVPADQRILDELQYWQEAWRVAKCKGIGRVIQVAYDWIHPGALGHHLGARAQGDIGVIKSMNAALRQALPEDAFIVELEDISGIAGRRAFYDARNFHWTRQPFSESGVVLLADQIAAGVRALTSGPCKVLVLDLDNTLWGGIVGEVGPRHVELSASPTGEAFRAFQRHVKALGRRGVVLAVCSKNNDADAREPFVQNPDMVLRLEDFASFVAGWESKPEGLKRIADELRLGLDSFVFFDDSPFERDIVRRTLPQVHVVAVPEDPAGYVAALQSGMWFEAQTLTDEDRRRSGHYQAEGLRRALQSEASNLDEYLASLGMTADVRAAGEADIERVTQLLAKTNQFNLTTRRHSADLVRRMMQAPRSVCFTLRLSDRFGDHGLVAIVLAVPEEGAVSPTLRIDSFVMSCRVIGRTVEACLMRVLVQRATELGYTSLRGQYIATAKNALTATFYERMGFQRTTDADEAAAVGYEFPLPAAALPITCVRVQDCS